jgi:hypothetical protein
MSLSVLLLSLIFGVLSSLTLGRIVLGTMFRFRTLPPVTRWSVLKTSALGALAFLPPLFLVGFVLFSVLVMNASVHSLSLTAAQEQIFVGLCGTGFLLQLFLGQRLAVGDELTVERFVTGEFLRLKKSDIVAVELYRPALNPRQKRVQLRLRSGETAQLDFDQDIVSDLREWIGLTAV